MNRREFMRIYNNFYVFLESVVSPTAIGEEKGSRDLGVRWGRQCVAGLDDDGILGASREAVRSRGEMAVGDAGEKHI
jgi:hypothetical protein